MIHYHGTPITPNAAAIELLQGRHAMVSFARPDQVELAAELCQSFVIDNGAFSHWQAGKGQIDVGGYARFVRQWERHPAFDWCVIPDVIDGDEAANDSMVARWFAEVGMSHGVPVWHLHESTDRLTCLARDHERVALGSSGEFSDVNTDRWWRRMAQAMDAVCEHGRPITKLHGLRMLDPTVFSRLPLASADSCSVGRNVGIDSKWRHGYLSSTTPATRALIMARRIEQHASASEWIGPPTQLDFTDTLLG